MIQIKNLCDNLVNIISERDNEKSRFLIAIDGRCASGKTTLSKKLQNILSCNVIHMDHFFLQPEQRTPERLNTAGENVDHERFLSEVLLPLKNGEKVSYSPFDCKTMSFGNRIYLDDKKINIIEGSYSCHNALFEYYDLRVFLDVSHEEQMKRIILRDGNEKAKIFASKWIPMEEMYFDTFDIANRSDFCFRTD